MDELDDPQAGRADTSTILEGKMAGITAFRNTFVQFIPPDGTFYFWLGPDERLGAGAITVTAHAGSVGVPVVPNFVEIVQMATRKEEGSAGARRFLDLVVRNNAHVGGPGGGFSVWSVYTAVVTP